MKAKRMILALTVIAMVFVNILWLPNTALATGTAIFSEGFEGELSSNWNYTASTKWSLDTAIAHRGGQSLKHSGHAASSQLVTLKGPNGVGNYVYEFWMYDDMATTEAATLMLELAGNEGPAAPYMRFGIQGGSYNGSFMCVNSANNLSYGCGERSVGWHQLVLDATDETTFKVYVNGEKKADVLRGTLTTVAAVSIINRWSSGTGTLYIDDFAVWNNIGEVPLHRNQAITSIEQSDGTSAIGEKEADPLGGTLTVNFAKDVQIPDTSDFQLYSRLKGSVSDADYTPVAGLAVSGTPTANQLVLSMPQLEELTEYKLAWQGLITADGKQIADDHILFATRVGEGHEMPQPRFFEDFEGALADNWNHTASAKWSLDSATAHRGEQSLKHSGHAASSQLVTLNKPNGVGNYVYEFWMYDDMATTEAATLMLELAGNEGPAAPYLRFGIQATAHNGNFTCANTANSLSYNCGERSVGWHQLILDATDASYFRIYVNGEKKADVPRSTLTMVAAVSIINRWSSGTGTLFMDDFTVWKNIGEVPLHRNQAITSMLQSDGTSIIGAEEADPVGDTLTVNFAQNIKSPAIDNFRLYSRPRNSVSDMDYALVTGLEIAGIPTANQVVLSMPGLEELVQYKLVWEDLFTMEGKQIANDHILFSTRVGDDYEAPIPLFFEGFEDEYSILKERWEDEPLLETSEDIAHNGRQSLLFDGISTTLPDDQKMLELTAFDVGDHVYELWMYDNMSTTTGATGMIRIADDSGKMFRYGIQANSYNGKYMFSDQNNATLAGPDRTEGWHQIVIDLSDHTTAKIYHDGVLQITRATLLDNVGHFQLINLWTAGGFQLYFDDLYIWESIHDVPLHRTKAVQSVVFDSGKALENAEGIVNKDGNITVKFSQNMLGLDKNRFALYRRDLTSESDSDYESVSDFRVVGTPDIDQITLRINALEPSSEYKLVFSDLLTNDGKALARDFITFQTSDEVNVERGVLVLDKAVTPTNYKAGDTLTVSVEVLNYDIEETTAILLIAEYEEGRLLNCTKSETVTIDRGAIKSLSASYTVSNVATRDVRGFLWEDGTHRPLSSVFPVLDNDE